MYLKIVLDVFHDVNLINLRAFWSGIAFNNDFIHLLSSQNSVFVKRVGILAVPENENRKW